MAQSRSSLLCETTEISPERSVAELTAELVKAGARQISSEYGDGGKIIGVSWSMRVGAVDIWFSMPAKIDGVFRILKARHREILYDTKLKALKEKSERVAWRQLLLWVKAQNAMIAAEMALPHQVYMPYAMNQQGKTLFEVWSSQLALPAPEKQGV